MVVAVLFHDDSLEPDGLAGTVNSPVGEKKGPGLFLAFIFAMWAGEECRSEEHILAQAQLQVIEETGCFFPGNLQGCLSLDIGMKGDAGFVILLFPRSVVTPEPGLHLHIFQRSTILPVKDYDVKVALRILSLHQGEAATPEIPNGQGRLLVKIRG